MACSVRNDSRLLKYRPGELAIRGGENDFEREGNVAVLDVLLEAGDDVEANVFALCGWKLREKRLEWRGDFRELRPKFLDRTGPAGRD